MIKNKRGSLTIEATIVFSTVFFVVLVMIYFCLMLYQQVYLQTIADKIAQRAANSWSVPSKDMYFGFVSKNEMEKNPLYWRITDTKTETKESRIQEFAKNDFDNHSLLKKSSRYIITQKVETEALIYKKISIEIEADYSNPSKNLLQALGLGEVITFKVRGHAIVNDPSEVIRNIDFVEDTVRQYSDKDMEGIKSSMTTAITKIFSQIKVFSGK